MKFTLLLIVMSKIDDKYSDGWNKLIFEDRFWRWLAQVSKRCGAVLDHKGLRLWSVGYVTSNLFKLDSTAVAATKN